MSHQEARATRHKQSDSQSHHENAGRVQRTPVSPLALRSVQTKLEVNEPGDAFEQQADAAADMVMRSPAPASAPPPEQPEQPSIQRMEQPGEPCADCDQNPRQIQREPLPDGETVQRDGDGLPAVSSHTASVIRSPGVGSPLSPAVRQRVEPHLGADLGQVRVHDDIKAAQAANSLRARAFTYGSDIFLNSGESAGDVRLMAHESAHVVQQSGGIQRQPEDEDTAEPLALDEEAPAEQSAAEPPPVTEAAPPAMSAAPAVAVPQPAASVAPPAMSAPASAPAAKVAPETPAALINAPAGRAVPAVEVAAAPDAGAGAPAPAAAGEAGAGVELLMPEPPAGLSPAAERRLAGVQARAGGAARAQSAMPAAETSVSEARGAVTEPAAETQARAEGALVAALDERPEPSAEIEELCARIRQAIRSKRPPDESRLAEARPDEMAQQAGGQLNQNVEGDASRVRGEYSQMQGQPQGAPASQPTPAAGAPPAQQTASVDAGQAAPDAVPAQAVSLDADVAANQRRIADAGMNSASAQAVQDGPIAEARAAQGELEETAARDPQEVMAEQAAAIASAQTDMGGLQARALAALQESRASAAAGSQAQQAQMVGSEEQMRQQVGRRANEIFDSAQSRVDGLLRDLPRTAMQRWDSGIARHSETFRQSLRRVQDWIDKRHESSVLAVWDYLTGLPGWVTEEYDRAEREFGDNVCELMRDISREVNGVVAACQAIIKQARADIDGLYASLPADMQAWAQTEQARFSERLAGLSSSVSETRDSFNRDLRQRAAEAVDEVRQQIAELRQAAGGLVGRVVDAVAAFLEDPVRAIINGLLSLVDIPPASFWALVNRLQQVISDIADDPLNFANNLMEALKQGFQQFFDNIGTHLLNGLLQWLFSAMGSVGVTIPTDFSLKSVITFFLQIMGISWARIRKLLAKHLGEQNVALIEQAWQLVSALIKQGPQGIFEMLKDQLNPQSILDMIMQTAIDFIKETLIKQVALRIIAMLNPAGAIAQAIQLIYKLLKWLFENAKRIFTLIETIVNGAANLIAGNISGMAAAVESALARILPIVIAFLADLLGLGDLPLKVAGAVKRLQDMVERTLDRVIKFLVDKAKALLKRLLAGRKPDEPDERTPEQKLVDENSAVSEAYQFVQEPGKSSRQVRAALRRIKQRYRLKRLEVVVDDESDTLETAHIVAEASPAVSSQPFTKPRMQHTVITFYHRPWHNVGEYQAQILGQEAGLKRKTLRQWWATRRLYDVRKAWTGSGRDPASAGFQQSFRAAERERRILQAVGAGVSQQDAVEGVDAFMGTQAALHDPDQVAGGEAGEVMRLGNRDINSSIGAQWPLPERGESVKRWEKIRDAVQAVPSEYRDEQNVDVELRVVPNPG